MDGTSFEMMGSGRFTGDVKSNAKMELTGLGIGFDRDLFVNADVQGSPTNSVARDIYQSPGFQGAETLSHQGVIYRQAVSVPEPCPCGEEALLDITGFVAAAQINNDNVALGMSNAELGLMLSSGAVPAGLTCGRFAVPSLALNTDIASQLTGRTALFIDGDLTLNTGRATHRHVEPRWHWNSGQAFCDAFIRQRLERANTHGYERDRSAALHSAHVALHRKPHGSSVWVIVRRQDRDAKHIQPSL